MGPTNDEKFKLLSANANELPIDTDFRYLDLTNDYRRKWQIDIQLDETRIASVVDSSGIINVATSLSLKPFITIPIRIVNQSPITARPSSLSWFLNGKEEYAENKTVSLFYECDNISRDKKDEQLYALCLTFESHEYLHVELLEREITANYAKWKLKISLSSDKISSSKRDKIRFNIKSINAYLDLPVAVITLSKSVKVE